MCAGSANNSIFIVLASMEEISWQYKLMEMLEIAQRTIHYVKFLVNFYTYAHIHNLNMRFEGTLIPPAHKLEQF